MTPDYIVRAPRLQEYTAKMRARVFEFVSGYMDREGPALRSKYTKEDARRFMKEFSVDGALMQSFIDFGTAKGVTYNKEQYEKDSDYLNALIKGQVARSLFGNEGYFRALLVSDPQFQKAMTLFPEARRIARL